MTYAYRMLPDGTGYVDSEGVHRGSPPTEEELKLVAIMYTHMQFFSQEKVEYKITDPYSPDPIENTIVYPNSVIPRKENK